MSAVVVGLGSPYRRDDAVGPLVARLVSERSAALDVGSVEDPLDLLGLWDDADLCVVVDAVRSGREPGDVWAIELEPASDVEGVAPSSSHGVGLV
ncbi:MAG: hydrogenase maturation protease, partial [Acidimicrobiales bacterium]